jgi:hypothetical protein
MIDRFGACTVDELLDVTVYRPALDELQVEVGRTLVARVQPGLTGDHREERHLHAVDEAGGHQRPAQRQAPMRAQRHVGLLLEPGDGSRVQISSPTVKDLVGGDLLDCMKAPKTLKMGHRCRNISGLSDSEPGERLTEN